MQNYFISKKLVKTLKRKAKKLSKEQCISHSLALEHVSNEYRFTHWHHVVSSIRYTESALNKSIILNFNYGVFDPIKKILEDSGFKPVKLDSRIHEYIFDQYEKDTFWYDRREAYLQLAHQAFICNSSDTFMDLEAITKFIIEQLSASPSDLIYLGKYEDVEVLTDDGELHFEEFYSGIFD